MALGQVNVTTYHNDNACTGQNLQSPFSRRPTSTASQFGTLFTRLVDGYIYQPLYLSGVTINGQIHNIVIVATEHDSVYAFDADKKSTVIPLWKTNFMNPPAVTTVNRSTDAHCGDLIPEIGITSTLVIDLATQTIYVLAKTKESGEILPAPARARHYEWQ